MSPLHDIARGADPVRSVNVNAQTGTGSITFPLLIGEEKNHSPNKFNITRFMH